MRTSPGKTWRALTAAGLLCMGGAAWADASDVPRREDDPAAAPAEAPADAPVVEDAAPAPEGDAESVYGRPAAPKPVRAVAGAKASSAAARAKKPDRKLNSISLLPVNFFLGIYGVEYERVLNADISLFIYPNYLNTSVEIATVSVGIKGGGADLGLRYYPFEVAGAGFFIEPSAGYAYVTPNIEATTRYASIYTLGVKAGFTYPVGGFIPLSLGAGIDYFWLRGQADDYVIHENNFRFRMRAAVGFAF